MGSNEIISPYLEGISGVQVKEQSLLARIAAGKLKSAKVAIVFGKTIHLHNTSREEFLQNQQWLKHEACHLRQYQRLGFTSFIISYLWESVLHGYHNNRFEQEAREAELL